MRIYCAGCGHPYLLDWRSKSAVLAYTCSCGANTFSKLDPMKSKGEDEELEQLIMPMSFWNYVNGKVDEIPHLQHYVGTSNAVNPLKSLLKESLKRIGSMSEDDCVICKARARAVAH